MNRKLKNKIIITLMAVVLLAQPLCYAGDIAADAVGAVSAEGVVWLYHKTW